MYIRVYNMVDLLHLYCTITYTYMLIYYNNLYLTY